ncbi:MAG: HD domain-containing protein [Oligoflexia bacterium]|nr:HD domain-containing protein [Oligoflexia bacterium]
MSVREFKICDPLYDYIYLEEDEVKIINHFIFQRLRSVRQLGFSDHAFPSGTHNRFTHSLGVCHLAGLAFDSIFNKNKSLPVSSQKRRIFRRMVKMSALLHDIGHGPLSHSSESLMPPLEPLNLGKYLKTAKGRQARHEDYSVKFIIEKEGLYGVLKEIGLEPLAIAQLLHPDFLIDTHFFEEEGLNFLPLLRQLISSDFDVDRMDYLYRDSRSCGVKYGLIDFTWLISHFDCYIKDQELFLAIASEALYTLESLLLGRQHMRLIVYFHHKSAIYNQMLKNYSKDCQWRLPSNILEYSTWTDSQLFEKLREDKKNEWAGRIIEKKPYLRLYELVCFEKDFQNQNSISVLKQELIEKNVNFMVIDSEKHSIKPSKSISKIYPVYLKNRALNQFQELGQSPAFLPLPHRKLQRIYVPPEDFLKAQNVLKQMTELK